MKRIVMISMVVALIALPAMTQEQAWQSTSVMQGSGSSYSPQVTDAWASDVDNMATTTESYSPAKGPSRQKKSDFGPGQDGGYQDPNSPIGDAWPLAVFAGLFGAYIAIRKHSIDVKKEQ